MSQTLPLTLYISTTITEQRQELIAFGQSLEAWLNFQTLGANWFADESKIVDFHYRLITSDELAEQCSDSNPWQELTTNNAYLSLNGGLKCIILIALEDELTLSSTALEDAIKTRVVEVTNQRAEALALSAIYPER